MRLIRCLIYGFDAYYGKGQLSCQLGFLTLKIIVCIRKFLFFLKIRRHSNLFFLLLLFRKNQFHKVFWEESHFAVQFSFPPAVSVEYLLVQYYNGVPLGELQFILILRYIIMQYFGLLCRFLA